MLSTKRARDDKSAKLSVAGGWQADAALSAAGAGAGAGGSKKRRSQQAGELRLLSDVAQMRVASAAGLTASGAWLSVDALGADIADVTVRGGRRGGAVVLRCTVGKHYPAHAPHVAVSAAVGAPAAAGLDVGASLRLRWLRSEYDGARGNQSGGRGSDDDPAQGLAALRLLVDCADADAGGGGASQTPPAALCALADLWLPIHTLLDVAHAVREALEAGDA